MLFFSRLRSSFPHLFSEFLILVCNTAFFVQVDSPHLLHVLELIEAISSDGLGGAAVDEGGSAVVAIVVWCMRCLCLFELFGELLGIRLTWAELAPGFQAHELDLIHGLLLASSRAHRRLLPQAIGRELVSRPRLVLAPLRCLCGCHKVVLSLVVAVGYPGRHKGRSGYRFAHDTRSALFDAHPHGCTFCDAARRAHLLTFVLESGSRTRVLSVVGSGHHDTTAFLEPLRLGHAHRIAGH